MDKQEVKISADQALLLSRFVTRFSIAIPTLTYQVDVNGFS